MISKQTHASECDKKANIIQKLVCETEPAILEALNPGLKIPVCGSQDSMPKVIPGHLPVSAVFVSCTIETLDSCTEISKSLLKNGRGATVNVIVQREQLHLIHSKLEEIIQASGSSYSNLNIIPVKSLVPSYTRDPVLFQNQFGKTQVISNPYAQLGVLGTEVWEEVANFCNLGFDTSYRNLAKFDSAFQEVLNNPERFYINKGFDPTTARFFRDKIHANNNIKASELTAISSIWGERSKYADGKVYGSPEHGASTMGGNFLALPGGTLIVGSDDWNKPDPDVLQHFAKNQTVKVVQIPKLSVGHIDEVFNIVPSKNECGFSILRASTKEMKNFLKLQPSDQSLGNLQGALEMAKISDEKKDVFEMFRLKTIHLNGKSDQSSINEFNSLRLKFLKETQQDKTAKDILANQELMDLWDQQQRQIEIATKSILEEIRRTTGKECAQHVIDLPIYITESGGVPIANPVNGLTVNGVYFYSLAELRLNQTITHGKIGLNQELETYQSYYDYNEYIQKKLKPIFGTGLQTVNTRAYTIGGGNFHCATTNIMVPCK